MPLDTLTNVKSRLGIAGTSDDALLGQLLTAADRWILRETGRDFLNSSFTEYFPGNTEFLCLANYPVASVSSLRVDPAGAFGPETERPPSDYVLHAARGVIQSRHGPFVAAPRRGLVNADRLTWTRRPQAVRVVYTVTDPVPDDVKHAYAQLIGHWYRQVRTHAATNFQNIQQQRFGEIDVNFQTLGDVPDEVKSLVARYRTPPV